MFLSSKFFLFSLAIYCISSERVADGASRQLRQNDESSGMSMGMDDKGMEDMSENHSNMNMGENGMDHMGDHNMNMGENGMDSMDENQVYCAKSCASSPDDPCGDGMAQTSSCISTTGEESMVGCTLATCQKACEGMNKELDFDVVDNVTCFPSKTGMVMFMQKETTEMSAISRGCQGAHQMQGDMFMIGATHMACNGAYKKEGVAFTGKSSDENNGMEDMSENHSNMNMGENGMENMDDPAPASTPTSTSTAVALKSITNNTAMTIVALFSLFLFY